uniref:Riboflavin synthase n=1 Tax=Planktothricoides sp. SpSt-374 TaxID=2282167 RepID=A0A7C3VHQ4_9CYAN
MVFTGLIQDIGSCSAIGNYKFKIICSSRRGWGRGGRPPVTKDEHQENNSPPTLILPDLDESSQPRTFSTDIVAQLQLGDSVAVDGICLTVEDLLPNGFIASASPETLRRTTLGEEAKPVNLETSLRAGGKIGGHFVTGHVDGIGCLRELVQTAGSWEITFNPPAEFASLWQQQIAPFIVPKGSIAVNGISLTVADCDAAGTWFKTAVIPHTFQTTNLHYLSPGSLVNIEADILGKYAAKFIQSRLNYAGFGESHSSSAADITEDFLTEHGFL